MYKLEREVENIDRNHVHRKPGLRIINIRCLAFKFLLDFKRIEGIVTKLSAYFFVRNKMVSLDVQ